LSVGRSQGLRAWVAAQEPPAPDAFLELVEERAASQKPTTLDTLMSETRVALRDALGERGERRGAFRLLAADAYLTYACELAIEGPDPEVALERIVAEVVAEAEES
jgi:hypothetical protein